MCGIFGYANFNKSLSVADILDLLVKGLKKVEYRGYDSAGICIDERDANSHVYQKVVRCVGNIDLLREKVFGREMALEINFQEKMSNHIGIAHTRWATHGEVCVRNSHPQQSGGGEFTVVHNGIMTNYVTVKRFLLDEGYNFTSDTDTEVICVLAEYLYSKKNVTTFKQLAVQLTHFVEGAYALLIKSVYFPGEVVACRKGSPLVIGIRQLDGQGKPLKNPSYAAPDLSNPIEVYFASDCNSFVEYTSKVIYLEDDDIAYYKEGSLQIYSANELSEECVDRTVSHLETTLDNLSKGHYDHFMLKEIYEQAESVVGSMRGRVDFATHSVRLGGFTPVNISNILESRRIIIISCGTSLNSCYAARPLWEEMIPIPIVLENASDFLDRMPTVHRDDTCFFVSQSGETADTLMALKYCRSRRALCVGVTNVVGSTVSRLTDFGVHLNAGAEVGVASTKAYTSQVVVLSLIALLLSADSVSREARRTEVFQGLAELSAKINETLKSVNDTIQRLARDLMDARSLIILGRGYDYATAMEAALKIKELSYVYTEGINSGELKHGPLALVDEHMNIISVCSHDKHFDKSKAALQQVKARKGNVIVITNDLDAEVAAVAKRVITVPRVVDCLQCIINVIPFQLLSYFMALMRGNNVDCPRNLAKSVTVQ